jgi:hypothetical protein
VLAKHIAQVFYVIIGELGLNFYTCWTRQAESRRVRLEHISLSDQCEMRYSMCISLVNEMRDVPII